MFTADAAPIGRPYWWDQIAWPELAEDLPREVDLLIIGAGYTGLSAAITAHDKGARVAVIDAGVPGQGASTRNGGMVGAHPRFGWDKMVKRVGAELAGAIFAERVDALKWMQAFVAREAFDCDYEVTGRLQLAYTPAQFEAQKALARQVAENSAADCQIVDKADLASEIATPLYHGGLLFPEHGGLHPVKYHQAMLAAVLRRAVPVLGDCAAEALSRSGATHLVRTPKGDIKADKLLVATNGYTQGPLGWFARRVFPLPSYQIATEPLPAEQIRELAPGRRMMVETRAKHSYYRISPDGSRIIFGGRAALIDIDLRTAAARLHDTMCGIWPSLKPVRITHVWSGYTGFSFPQMPVAGEENGIHYSIGYSGSGTVMAPYLGAKSALTALGDPAGETAYRQTRLEPRWFYRGGTPHFMKPMELWQRHWVDRKDEAGR